MTNYDASGNYYTPISSPIGNKKRVFGGMVACSLIGMNAYYLPINKKSFVEKAFEIHKDEISGQILALRNAADEIEHNKLSTNSKLILQEHGLSEDIVQIANKCINLDNSVNDEATVKSFKKVFEDGFDSMKKKASLRNNEASEAFRQLKRNKFWWGTGIGAGIGLALGLMSSRD